MSLGLVVEEHAVMYKNRTSIHSQLKDRRVAMEPLFLARVTPWLCSRPLSRCRRGSARPMSGSSGPAHMCP